MKKHAGISTLAIGKATRALVDETRRQLQFIVGAGYTECNPDSISSATAYPSALGAFLPVLLSIWVPCAVAFLMGPRCLTTFVTGSCMTGLALSLSLSNAGSA
jgi:Na+/H+-translocating membrane pyrophosphatase